MKAAQPAPMAFAGWAVLCDFDGTVCTDDVTDSLLLRFARPGWEELETAWREGAIGSRECMAGQVALLECSRDELDRHLEIMQIDPQFEAFAAAVRNEGAALRIVSDGLDLAIHSILHRHGILDVDVFASRLVPIGPRGWKLEFPHARSGCASATCKCALADMGGDVRSRFVLMVGDGASDFCVAGRADLTLARQQLLAHCAERGLRHHAVSDFGRALAIWNELSRAAVEAAVSTVDEEALDARR